MPGPGARKRTDYLTAIYAVAENNSLFLWVPAHVSSPEPVQLSRASKRDFGRGGLCRMRRAFSFSLSFVTSDALAAGSGKSLATISGTVRDNRGNPLPGALVSLVREGFKTIKEARTDKQGN